MRNSNPVFSNLEKQKATMVIDDVKAVSFHGIAIKSIICLLVAIGAGILAPTILGNNEGLLYFILFFSGITSFIMVFVGMRSTKMAAPMAIGYSVVNGLFLGILTYVVNIIVYQEFGFANVGLAAIIGTASVFGVMFVLYYTGIIKVTQRLRSIVVGSLIAILVATLLMWLFGMGNLIRGENFGLSVLFSAIMIIIGALMLTINFDSASKLVEMKAPKQYEWQVALGLMVTIVWLYVEILRLAIILLGRNRN